jgi:subtilisin family serine protease
MARNSTEFMGVPDELYHWIPGEMVVVVRLPRILADEAQETLVEQVQTLLNELLRPYSIVVEPYGTAGRWRDIPTMPPIRRRVFLSGLHRQQPLAAIFFHARHRDRDVRDAVPMALTYLQRHLDQLAERGLHVVSAMPNWLVMAAPLLYGEGGAAYPPRPAPTLDVPGQSGGLLGWRLHVLEQNLALDVRGGEDVLVAVLDTAQHPDRLRSAALRPEWRRNWLLQQLVGELLNEDGSFAIEYDRYPLTNDVHTGRDRYGDARYYPMPDHGLSVAGLIRDAAPRARIRLVRVLNDYGGGDLYALFAALTDLEREMVADSIRRLVINLSLTVMPDIRRLPYIWFDNRQWASTQLHGVSRILNHIEDGLRLIFDGLHARGALIVAAAGNDSLLSAEQGKPPRPPRAPARYETVLSVTAVNSSFRPASFANAANIPPSVSGVATFGGDGYGKTDVNALPDAVRGLFIAPTFPGGEQNPTAWADWSGTSFATAIISGLGAHLMAQGWTAENVMNRLASGGERRGEMLFGTAPDVPHLLTNTIRVQQRFRVS